MAKSLAFFLVLVVAICSLLLIIVDVQTAATPDCKDSGLGCFPPEGSAVSLGTAQNRKMGAGLKEKIHTELVDFELRRVPSGPDPLHRNGDVPKKPRTDP